MDRVAAFERQARHFARTSPLYERLALQLKDDSLLPSEVRGRYPLQLLSGLHYLVLSGRASWDDVRAALVDEREFLDEWVATERVQTNEVQRCWWLVPCFVDAARRLGVDELDCLELGCSGGLNLIWDRYGYEYERGSFPGELVLRGEERSPAPVGPLPHVRSRLGIDAAPPDLHSDEDVRYLKSFVWADQAERLARLDAAVEIWRRDPPEIVVGDLLDVLPALLERGPNVVWQTAVLNYLAREQQQAVRDLLAQSDAVVVEAWLPSDGSHDYYGLFVNGDEVAHADHHGAWLEWLA